MIARDGDRIRVDGPITVANVRAMLEAGDPLLPGARVVDLSAVSEVDSSAISLLLEWQRRAQRAGGSLRFENLPANMQSLARLYGVSELIAR